MELTRPGGLNESNEQIVGSKDVVITTDIVTRFEDADTNGGPSSADSTISGEDLIREHTHDARRVV
jgi:hypothetical protein